MNFSLNIEPKLNKNFILSNLTEEQIFSYYIGSEVKSKKLFRSKLRKDRVPTCSFYRNKHGTLTYKDFATSQSLNCFGYVMELFKCDYIEALRIIANDFGLIKDKILIKNKGVVISKDFKIEEKEFTKIQVEIQEFTDLELKWWSKFGINKELLKKYNVYSCKHVFLNDQLIAKSQQNCPIFGYYGKKYQGLEMWRIYFPKNRANKFLGNWPSKKVQGYEQLPESGNLLCITKSMKDVMCLNALGIDACAPCSETQFIPENILEDLKNRFKHIVVFFDVDLTGISFMNKLKKKYPEFIYTWIPRKYNCKDISDFYHENGKNKTKNLIKQFLIYLKNKK